MQCLAHINLEFRPRDSKLFESGVFHLAMWKSVISSICINLTHIFLTVKLFSCRAKSLLTDCEGEFVVVVGGEGEVVGRDVNQPDFGRQAFDGIGSLDRDIVDRGPKQEIFSESERLQDEW